MPWQKGRVALRENIVRDPARDRNRGRWHVSDHAESRIIQPTLDDNEITLTDGKISW